MTQSRRTFLARSSALGLAAVLAPELMRNAAAQTDEITDEVLSRAEQLAGLEFTEEERELMRESVADHLSSLRTIADMKLENQVPPAMLFKPLGLEWASSHYPGNDSHSARPEAVPLDNPDTPAGPPSGDDLAFATIDQIGLAIRKGWLSCSDVTEFFIERLEKLNPTLHFMINPTFDRARAQAKQLDDEAKRGSYRGPLHGIPWGAKDLLAVSGSPTTWGAAPFEGQVIDTDAEVVRRLDEAGAVLLCKTSVGALAWGDVWFGETCRNPWNPEQGSSGSSAGSASAVAAGALPFALGTETLGSIVSPSSRCGATGIRPTHGRVPRTGCMALTWSMDKIGPITRNVSDAWRVLQAIQGAHPGDRESVDAGMMGVGDADVKQRLRFGYVPQAFESEEENEVNTMDRAALEQLRALGVHLEEFSLPELPVGDMLVILEVEAAAAFDELTRTNRDDELVRQIENAWPNVFRAAQLVPGVQYVQAQRARSVLMQEMESALGDLDGYVTPSFGGPSLAITNLTGHPCVVLPHGFREDGTPASFSFIGRNYHEGAIVALASMYQKATGHHLKRPGL
jgi:Asp-tRNA(Asn)/Glu-tRNA(Gln) amidotransferase A subunit family amidase